MAKVSNETFEGTPSSREAGLMAKVSNETFDGTALGFKMKTE